MTENSYICQFIKDNPDWREKFDEKKIRVKQNCELAIFNYETGCDFSDPVVQEARGIIINLETLTVVCWPFRKFGNYTVEYADDIDWSSARVQEKLDGSFLKYFYNEETFSWQWSTMSCINAQDATLKDSDKTYYDLLREADNYEDAIKAIKDKNYTYMFELVGPENKIVVSYPRTHLYHIGTRSNLTGEECVALMPYLAKNGDVKVFDHPKEYPLHSLADCVEAVQKLNSGIKNCNHEGFVVVDKDWHRVKVKSPEYLEIHWAMNNGILTKDNAMKILMDNDGNCDDYCEKAPMLAPAMRFYAYQYAELLSMADKTATYARGLLSEYEGDRKAIVPFVKKLPLCTVGFKALTDPRDGRDILKSMNSAQIKKHIPQYSEISIFSY